MALEQGQGDDLEEDVEGFKGEEVKEVPKDTKDKKRKFEE